jgi:hypothetical protein
MRLEIHESVAPENWDDLVCFSGGNIHHSSIWASYVKASLPQVVPQFISLVSPAGERCGAALGFYESSSRPLWRGLTGRLWFDAIPVTCPRESNALSEFLRLVEMHARKLGAVELFIDSYAYSGGDRELAAANFELMPRLEFVLALDESEDELWKGLHRKRTTKIRKAEKMGVTIEVMSAAEGLRELRRLQGESGRRILARGGPDIAAPALNEGDPLEALLASDCARIVGARLDGEVLSADLFTRFNDLVYGHVAGHSVRGLKNQTGTLLIWEMIKQYRNEGAKSFNLGGCQVAAVNEDAPEYGVYVYKKAFGGRCVECSGGRKILRKAVGTAVTAVRSILSRQ